MTSRARVGRQTHGAPGARGGQCSGGQRTPSCGGADAAYLRRRKGYDSPLAGPKIQRRYNGLGILLAAPVCSQACVHQAYKPRCLERIKASPVERRLLNRSARTRPTCAYAAGAIPCWTAQVVSPPGPPLVSPYMRGRDSQL